MLITGSFLRSYKLGTKAPLSTGIVFPGTFNGTNNNLDGVSNIPFIGTFNGTNNNLDGVSNIPFIGTFYGVTPGVWTTTNAYTDSSTLSNSNREITWSPVGGGSFIYYRTTNAISGKTYCEFQSTQRTQLLPISFGITTITPDVFFNSGSGNIFAGNGACGLPSSGFYNNGSQTASGSYNFVQGDRIGIAFDPTTKNLWFSKNGVWISGNPATGTSPTMTLGFGSTYYFYFSAYSCFITSGTYINVIYPDAATQLYAAPSGFSPYQY